jgi:AraC-like DNA-binding protein
MPIKPSASDRYTAASGLGSAVGDTAAQFGLDITPICAALELDPADFSNLTGRISLDRLCRLLEACALLTKDECFGLKCVRNFKAGATGPYGFGLISAPTALDFFRFMSDYIDVVTEVSYSRLTIADNGAEFVWTFSPMVLLPMQLTDLGLGLIVARLRSILGSSIDALEIGLERQKPDNMAPFRELLPRRLSFGRRVNSIRLPQELFSVANPQADKQLFQLMDLQCKALRPQKANFPDFADEMRDFVLSRISENNINLADAAEYFRISERTLQRRLSECGTSLADIRDEVRRDLAGRFLVETDLSASEIALRLGYSQPSAFTRSTMRWFGTTPREYRKAQA